MSPAQLVSACTLPVRRGRSRLLPGHRPILHLLVPQLPPCSDRIGLSDRAADRSGRWRADFDGIAGTGWVAGSQGLADHVSREGIPTFVIGILTLFVLTDKPEQATFLTQARRLGCVRGLTRSDGQGSVGTFTLWQSLIDPKVLLLSLNIWASSPPASGCCFSFRRSSSRSASPAT